MLLYRSGRCIGSILISSVHVFRFPSKMLRPRAKDGLKIPAGGSSWFGFLFFVLADESEVSADFPQEHLINFNEVGC